MYGGERQALKFIGAYFYATFIIGIVSAVLTVPIVFFWGLSGIVLGWLSVSFFKLAFRAVQMEGHSNFDHSIEAGSKRYDPKAELNPISKPLPSQSPNRRQAIISEPRKKAAAEVWPDPREKNECRTPRFWFCKFQA